MEIVRVALLDLLQRGVGYTQRFQDHLKYQDWEEPKCLLSEHQLSHVGFIRIMKCYTDEKSNEETVMYWYEKSWNSSVK